MSQIPSRPLKTAWAWRNFIGSPALWCAKGLWWATDGHGMATGWPWIGPGDLGTPGSIGDRCEGLFLSSYLILQWKVVRHPESFGNCPHSGPNILRTGQQEQIRWTGPLPAQSHEGKHMKGRVVFRPNLFIPLTLLCKWPNAWSGLNAAAYDVMIYSSCPLPLHEYVGIQHPASSRTLLHPSSCMDHDIYIYIYIYCLLLRMKYNILYIMTSLRRRWNDGWWLLSGIPNGQLLSPSPCPKALTSGSSANCMACTWSKTPWGAALSLRWRWNLRLVILRTSIRVHRLGKPYINL